MTTEDALRDYLTTRGIIAAGLPREQWYADNWVRFQVGSRRIPVLPIHGFKKSFMLHDIHHLLSHYDTSWKGELEIAAWELSSGGCRHYFLYWIDRLIITAFGVVFAPVATWRAFRRGWHHRNCFDRDPEDLLDSDFSELRRRTLDPQGLTVLPRPRPTALHDRPT